MDPERVGVAAFTYMEHARLLFTYQPSHSPVHVTFGVPTGFALFAAMGFVHGFVAQVIAPAVDDIVALRKEVEELRERVKACEQDSEPGGP